MAEIRVLPVRPCGLDQSNRLHADLAAAHARGEDLGPRAMHIHASAERLLEMGHELELAIENLDRTLSKLGLQYQLDDLRHLLGKIYGMASTAQKFPILACAETSHRTASDGI